MELTVLIQSISKRIQYFQQKTHNKMDPNERKNRSDKYHEKKQHHDKHDKLQKLGLNEEEGNLIESIEMMNASELNKFMENKFDKMIKSNQKLFPKICRATQKRINGFLKDFKKEEEQRLVGFIRKHTGQTITPEDIKQVFSPSHFQPHKLGSNDLIHVAYIWSQKNEPKIFMAKVSIFQPNQQFSYVKQKFYIKGIPEEALSNVDLDYKRFKKDCGEILDLYVKNMRIVEAALDEPDL